MANADGKSSPFNPDGKSGATGNSAGYENCHIGENRSQKMGPNADLHAASIPEGGRILKLDPPSDRQGLVGQTAEGGMKHKPFKLGGGDSSTTNTGIEQAAGSVGDVDDMG